MSETDLQTATRPGRPLLISSFALWLVLVFALPLLALVFRVAKFGGFPLEFWITAQGVLIGLMLLSDLFVARAGGERTKDTFGSAAGIALPAIGSAGFLGYSGLISSLGYDGLAFPLGIAAGLAATVIMIAPRFSLYPAGSVTEFVEARFGGQWPRRLTALIIAIAAVPVLAGELRGGALALQVLSGVSYEAGCVLAATAVIAGCLALVVAGGRWPAIAGLAPIATYTLALGAYAVLLGLIATGLGFSPIPHFVYGRGIDELAASELALRASKLADLAAVKSMTSPFLQISAWSFAGIVLALAAGISVWPPLLGRYLTRRAVAPANAPRRVARALSLVVLLFIGLAAFATMARLSVAQFLSGRVVAGDVAAPVLAASDARFVRICGVASASPEAISLACSKASGSKGLLRLEDIAVTPDALMFAAATFAGVPAAILALAGLAAALVAFVAGTAVLGSSVAEIRREPIDAAGKSPEPIAPTLALVGVVIALASLALAYSGQFAIPALLADGMNVVAATIFPVVALGLFWRPFAAPGAVAAMIAGATVALGYIVFIRFFPVTMVEWTGALSAASPGAVRKFETLRAASETAADPAARDAAMAALNNMATGIAPWNGLKPEAISLLAMPVASAAALLATALFPRGTGRPF